MNPYDVETRRAMKRLFQRLSEKERRRYAAIEAAKLGRGGMQYMAGLLGCDRKTIRRGRAELRGTDPAAGRVRKKGAGDGDWNACTRRSMPTSWMC